MPIAYLVKGHGTQIRGIIAGAEKKCLLPFRIDERPTESRCDGNNERIADGEDGGAPPAFVEVLDGEESAV